ncbi:MAG: translocation/assembly module TamB domain-containing protein [Jannaschia sp.]
MRLFFLPLALFLALPAQAQDTTEERDRGFLTALIEDNLAAPGLSVRIDGFEGALSSEASLERLTISDDQGPWLRMENVVLDWNRGALLRGRLEVTRLSAGLISVERAPLPPEGVEALPDAGSSGFSLPDLPVSVDIGLIAAERIDLGAALIGQEVSLALEASAQLADGSGTVSINATRLDDVAGTFDIAASYDAETTALEINVAVSEAEGGLAAGLLNLPGQPAIDLTVAGSGPLDDFAADIAVASEGQDRLTGRVTLAGVEAGRRFSADLGGDVTSLFAPRYQPFFGDDIGFLASGVLLAEGGTRLDRLDISTAALSLSGRAEIGADGWPSVLDITGELAAEDGTPVLLPTAEVIQLGRSDFALRHDASVSDDWDLNLSLRALNHPVLTLELASIAARGRLVRQAGVVTAATSDLSLSAGGMDFVDAALAQAVGSEAELTANIGWAEGASIRIDDLRLRGPALSADGAIEIATDDSALPVTLTLRTVIEDLARLSGLAGRELGGAATLAVSGGLAPVGGAFDLTAVGETTDLTTGIAQADAVLAGSTNLTLAARRDVTGTYLDTLDLINAQATVSGNAALLSQDAPSRTEGQASAANLNVALSDGAIVDPRLEGAVTAEVMLAENPEGFWSGTAALAAPQNVALNAAGTFTGPAPDVTFDLSVPQIAAFVDGIPGALAVNGRATGADGVWSLDAGLQGPWGLVAAVNGPIAGAQIDIDYTASLPDLSAPVPALSTVPALAGPVSLAGRIVQEGAAFVTDTRLDAPEDVTLRLRGPMTGPAPRLEIAATVPRLEAFVAAVEGTLSLDAVLARTGEDWTVDARATGPEGTRATVETVLTDTPLAVDFTVSVPRLAAFAPGVPGGLDAAGMAVQAPNGWQIDLDGTGPYDAALSVSASLPEAGPELDITARIPNSATITPQLAGPLDVALSARQRDGIWSADVDASGPFGATATARARLPEAGPEVSATLRLPNAAAVVPQLPGALTAQLDAQQRNGVWRAELDAGGPLGARLAVAGVVAGAPIAVDIDLAVPDISPLAPDISGPLRVSGAISQPADDYRLDLRVNGPSGTTADVSGTVAAGGRLDLAVSGGAPLGLANGILAPRRLAGVAAFDLTVNGPPGLQSVSGTVRTSGAALSLPTLRNGLEPVDATITLSGGRAQIDVTAGLQTGGSISVTGPVDLAAPFNANLQAGFRLVLEDPKLYTARVQGDLSIAGPLTGGALISGRVIVDEAEIAVPSSGLTAIGDLPPIRHLSVPRPVQRTLARAGQDAASQAEAAGPSGPEFGLNLTVSAPGRIFVRGRGLDAELGGNLQLTGTTNTPVTAGAFELVRGRLDILQQRFDLDEGEISFQGSLIPYIRLVAITETDALTASISVEGPANDIGVVFGSSPDVPQEEILAQIFFGRDLSQLSPLQALQLANSVATLAGRGSGGLLERLRGNAGLDDLDVTTDSEGNTAIRAGKYLSDNLYTDVEVGQTGDATISLNLDLTPNFTVRGSTGAAGESSVGVFFERDY